MFHLIANDSVLPHGLIKTSQLITSFALNCPELLIFVLGEHCKGLDNRDLDNSNIYSTVHVQYAVYSIWWPVAACTESGLCPGAK